MKTKFTQGNSLSIDKNCKSQNSTFSGILKSALMLLILFACFTANAQQITPVANISGPLTTTVNGSNLVFKAEVFAQGTPIVGFSLEGNTSGATIVSQGTYQVDPATGLGYQTVTVNPGAAKGRFSVAVYVTNSATDKFKGRAAMSVAVQ